MFPRCLLQARARLDVLRESPMDFVWTCSMVALGWFFGGIIGGATGIGTIMIAMPLLTVVLSPSDAVLVSCLTGLFGTVHLAYSYRKACSWGDIRDLVIGAIPGCILGALILRIASMQVLQLMVCAMLACFVVMQCFHRFATYRLPDSTFIGITAGLVCGFVSGSVAMVGAPLGIYVLMKHWSPDRSRGNMSVFYVFTGLASVASQAFAGLYTATLFQVSLAGFAGCLVGQVMGVHLGRRINQKLFQRIVLAFLALAAVILFLRAME